jgi:tetratricopeptide (TPR) repeat protein
MAETLARVLYTYQPLSDFDSIQEYVALVEVTEQGYLNAVRQGSPTFTPAALGRLAYMASREAKRMANLPTPTGLAPDETAAFKQGLKGRVQQLEGTATEALKACAEQAWTTKVFTIPVRECLRGRLPDKDPVAFDKFKPRSSGSGSATIEELRQKLAKNPNELETLRRLGDLYLQAGDAHMARLVFARASQSGGGPEDLNNLGVASWRIGDATGALDAFGQAADGGLEAGRLNVSAVLSKLGLNDAARTALEKWPDGKGGGIRL